MYLLTASIVQSFKKKSFEQIQSCDGTSYFSLKWPKCPK